MSDMQDNNQVIYGKNAIEFVTVAAETCLFLENAISFEKKELLDRALKILPLLYLKTTTLEPVEQILEDEVEEFVTEEEYETIRQYIAQVLGYSDRYLEVFTRDIQLSDEGIASDISEDLADIYQDLKNFLLRYQIGNEDIMTEALAICQLNFKEYWGQRLVNCMRALHNAYYNSDDKENEDIEEESLKDSFLSHQRGDIDEDIFSILND